MEDNRTITACPQSTASEPRPRYDPAEYPSGSMKWLAACILEERERARGGSGGRDVPWYMLNLNHPVLRELMSQYKTEQKLPAGVALGDMERTMWELGLLNAKTVRQLRKHYTRKKRFGQKLRSAMQGEADLEDILLFE